MALGADFLAAIGESEQPAKTGIGEDFLAAIGETQLEEQQQEAEQPVQDRSLLSKLGSGIKEAFIGTKRKTESTEQSNALIEMPEIKDDIFSTFASLFADDDQLAKMMKIRYPELETRKDEKGNTIFVSQDGKEYTNKPGASKSDIPRLIANVLAFSRGAKSPTLRGRMLGAAGTQAGIESLQAQMGGDADISDVALAAATEPIGDVVSLAGKGIKEGVKKGVQALRPVAGEVVEETAEQFARELPEQITRQADIQQTQAPELGLGEFGEKVAKASRSKFMKQNAIREVLEQTPIDQETFEAAETLGITDYLQPEHLTTNKTYKSLAQGIKSLPASKAKEIEREGLKSIADKSTQIINDLGGTEDYSNLSYDIKEQFKDSIAGLKDKAGKYYGKVAENVGTGARIEVNGIESYFKKRLNDVSYNSLSNQEKFAYNNLLPKTKTVKKTIDETIDSFENQEFVTGLEIPTPTKKTVKREVEEQVKELPKYGDLDAFRKRLNKLKFSATKADKDADDKVIDDLLSVLNQDQRSAAESFGALEDYDLAQATSALYKNMQKDRASIFGKKIDESLVNPLTRAIKELPKGNEDKFINFIKTIPEDQRKRATASGLAIAMEKNAKNGQLSFKGFADFWDNLKGQKRSYAALMNNLPNEAKRRLDAYAKISRTIADTSEFIGTGRLAELREGLEKGAENILIKLYDKPLVKRSIQGLTAMGSPAIGSTLVIADTLRDNSKKNIMELADNFLMSNDFITAFKTMATDPDKAIKQMSNSAKFKSYINAVNKKNPLPETPEQWIRSALQAGRQQREDNQNDR